jgi:hypothetical protein
MGVAVAFSMTRARTDAGDRGAGTRGHTRAETPFFTGRRKPPAGHVADLV